MPKGGPRLGSGRKPTSALQRALTGNPGHRGRVLEGPGAGAVPMVAPIAPVEVPVDLTSETRAVWDQLAPHALQARTLLPATALAFRVLCCNVVLERALAQDPETRGGTNHRGLIARVDAELAAFTLRPFGKPMLLEAAPAANPLDQFFHRRG